VVVAIYVEAELSWLWLEEGGDTYLKAWKRMVGSEPNGTGLSANTQQLKRMFAGWMLMLVWLI
jgi:hypothetical protein